jgi:hypothetical protein
LETKIKETKSEKGRKGRASGKRFEIQVRKDLEKRGWLVVKWANQVDLEKSKIVPARGKFNPFLGRVMSEGSGFPDLLVYKLLNNGKSFEIIGVESKLGKYLDAEEKKKARWLIDHRVFNKILVAYKKERGKIEYEEFR